jgi:Na+(H+)/acetate symporter ActP
MKKNVGTTDRVIRVLLAVVVAVLYFTNQISGTLAVILVLTSVVSFCPLYLPFKLSTKKTDA